MTTGHLRSGALAALAVLLLGLIGISVSSTSAAAQTYQSDCNSNIEGIQPCPTPDPTYTTPQPTDVPPTATPTPRADLAITATTPRKSFRTTETNTVSFTLRNNGPSTASNIPVTIGGTSGIRILSTTQSVGTFTQSSSTVGRWTVPSLSSGATATITAVITSNPTTQAQQALSGIIISTFTPTDPATSNNRADQILYFSDLQFNIRQTVGLQTSKIVPGQTTRFFSTVVNDGPTSAPNVRVTLNTFTGLSYVKLISTSTGTWDPATKQWSLGSLPSGATARIEVEVAADDGTAGKSIQLAWWAQSSNPNNELDPNDSNWGSTFVAVEQPTCRSGRVVNRSFTFDDELNNHGVLGGKVAFTLQFTNLSYCYGGGKVWLQGTPQTRAYINETEYSAFPGPNVSFENMLATACTTTHDPTGERLDSVSITCQLTISNDSFADMNGFRATIDVPNGTSSFDVPARLNYQFYGEISLGGGTIGANVSANASRTRYYTLRITNNGQALMSGVGDNTYFFP